MKFSLQTFPLEPLKLLLGKQYNLNNVKEISVTDEFLGLDRDVIDCQNDEDYEDCKTRAYLDTLLEECKCLPFGISKNDEVTLKLLHTVLETFWK